MTTFRAGSATDIGNARAVNQDAMYTSDTLLIVADGMGGHAGGEVASQSAVAELEKAFREHPTGKGLLAGTKVANREVFERSVADEELHGMGTTLVAAALVPGRNENRIALINVGDSRAYVLENGDLRQLTDDHSLVEEMLRQGEITQAAAEVHPYRHVLTRAIGINGRVEVDAWTLTPHAGTRILLCSDGLTNECDDTVIAEVLLANDDPVDAASALIRRALDHGGNDNITAVVADIISSDGQVDIAPPKKTKRARSEAPGITPAASEPARPQSRAIGNLGVQLITFRVALFLFIFVLILASAVGFSVWFDKATYFVGVDNSSVAIFNGRPGGFLWFQPTLVRKTSLSTSQILPEDLTLLHSGMLEPSYMAASQIVTDLASHKSVAIGTTQGNSSGSANG